VSSISQILPSYGLLVNSEHLIEGTAHKSKRQQVEDAALCEYLDLDLNGKIVPI
jgi:hypothetical protein